MCSIGKSVHVSTVGAWYRWSARNPPAFALPIFLPAVIALPSKLLQNAYDPILLCPANDGVWMPSAYSATSPIVTRLCVLRYSEICSSHVSAS
jgi:hypothetical protein